MLDPFSAPPGAALPQSTLPLLHADQVRMRLESSRAVFQPTLAQPSRPPAYPWEVSRFSPLAQPPTRPAGPPARVASLPAHPFPPALPGQASSAWAPALPITLPLQWGGGEPPRTRSSTPGGPPDPKSFPAPRAHSVPPQPGQRPPPTDLRRAALSPTGSLPKVAATVRRRSLSRTTATGDCTSRTRRRCSRSA